VARYLKQRKPIRRNIDQDKDEKTMDASASGAKSGGKSRNQIWGRSTYLKKKDLNNIRSG